MINKVILLGNVGSDPESRSFSDGNSVCNFSMATQENYKEKNSGEWKSLTEWHKISVFGSLAEYASQRVQKGVKIYVEGKIKTRKWTDKSGVEKYTTEIYAEKFRVIDTKKGEQDEKITQNTHSYVPPKDDLEDYIPF